jgi:AcrR family transcriptional regulator
MSCPPERNLTISVVRWHDAGRRAARQAGKVTATARTYAGVPAAERVAQRRARLLDAGLELYGTRGFAATGVKDLCRAAGLTDRYFYESFRDSRALFLAVFDREADRLLEAVAAAVLAVPAEPEPQVRAAIATFVRALSADPRTARVIFSEPAAVGPEAERHMRATLARFADLVEATARIHVDAPPLALRVGALGLVGAIERVLVEWLDGGLRATPAAVEDALVAFFVASARSFGL